METRWGNTDEPRAPQIIATNENINYATSYTISSLSFDVKSVNMKKGVTIYCQFADHAKKIFKAGKFLKKNRTKYKPVNYIQIWNDESRDERGFEHKYVP